MYGVTGGKVTGGGRIGGRATVGRAAGVGVPSCGCSSRIASRAGVWAGWRFGCLNLALGVGVRGSAIFESAKALTTPAGVEVPLFLRRFEALVDSPRNESTDEPLGLWRRPRLLRVVRGVDAWVGIVVSRAFLRCRRFRLRKKKVGGCDCSGKSRKRRCNEERTTTNPEVVGSRRWGKVRGGMMGKCKGGWVGGWKVRTESTCPMRQQR
jgi:hypothetical protein